MAHIRTLITAEGLGVGDALPTERELCERFATSRNTVREAMRILKAYGVVEVRPKVGATIIDNRMSQAFEQFGFNLMEISDRTFWDIQNFRRLLEVGSVETLLDRITAADLAELRVINSGLKEAADVDRASETDFRFHTRILAVLDNLAILDVYQIMKPVTLRIMKIGKTRRVYETSTWREHEGVIDALEARDALAYQYRMKTHLEAGFAHLAASRQASE